MAFRNSIVLSIGLALGCANNQVVDGSNAVQKFGTVMIGSGFCGALLSQDLAAEVNASVADRRVFLPGDHLPDFVDVLLAEIADEHLRHLSYRFVRKLTGVEVVLNTRQRAIARVGYVAVYELGNP